MNLSKRNIRLLFAALIIILTPITELRAQQNDANVKYRLALSYEQEGDWERAMPVYESLYLGEPRNYVYFDGLRHSYTQLKQYDKALSLVQKRIGTTPTEDDNLRAILGMLLYLSGQETKADSTWGALIQSGQNKVGLYRLVAGQMTENRMYDRAIQLYLRARDDTKNDRLFAEELSWLYGSFQQYALATKELLNLLRGNPVQLPSIQARMASFTGREEGLKQAYTAVREAVKTTPSDLPFRTLLAWLCMERKDYDAALVEYRVIDKLRNAKGQELYGFAQRALQERAYTSAAAAFREVINNYPARERLPMAQFGFARSIEELSAGVDPTTSLAVSKNLQSLKNSGQVSETQPSYEAALTLYDAIIKEYEGSEYAAQALFRVGLIRRNKFFDLDGALEAFERVRAKTQAPGFAFESTMNIGEVLTLKNDLTNARGEYRRVSQTSAVEYRDRAQFKLAELDYFEAQFDSALVKIQRLASNVTTDLANDALQLQYFIQENKTSAPAGLAAFAKADLLMRQNKYSEALQQFQEVIRQYPAALLLDDAVMKTAELHLKLKQTPEALAAYQKVAEEMPTSIFRDAAQMRIAETYERVVHDKAKAQAGYETLLAKYPNSLYAEEARKRIRALRGDAS